MCSVCQNRFECEGKVWQDVPGTFNEPCHSRRAGSGKSVDGSGLATAEVVVAM